MPQLLQDKPGVVFQHDRVPPHIHNEVTTFLNRQLPEQWIGQGVQFLASVISRSDPLDLFLWGFVKDEVYFLPMLITLKNLKDQI